MEARLLADEIAARLLSVATTPAARAVRREYSRRVASAGPEVVIQAALLLMRRGGVLTRFVAYEMVQGHRAAVAGLTRAQLMQFGQGIDSWAAVDCFGCILSGPAWKAGKLSTAEIRRWSKSDDRWWRRAALVSTIALSRRGETEDVRRTLEICALAVSDHDDMVVKALSWALRELAKKNPAGARAFVERYRGNLAARVIREVKNKIETGLKNPRR